MSMAMKFGFGQPLKRKEDDALVRGAGRYIADVMPDGALQAVVVRSPHAHAKFTIRDLSAVRAMKGVRLVLTAADVADLGPMPTPGVIPGPTIDVPYYPVLARDVVKHVGDAVAFVVADTLAQARDAAEAIAIDWQELPHVVGAMAALDAKSPRVWPDRSNLSFETTMGDEAATKATFAQAERVVETTIVNQRLVTNYMDTRGVVAEFDGSRYTLTLGSQGSHIIRDIIGVEVMKLKPEQMRVITPDVGGGFGTKLFPYREYALAAVAAERLRQPVRWVSDRSEHFLADSHGRDNISTARLALDDKGKFLALELDIVADMGAYLSCYAPYIPWLGMGMATGPYDIPIAHVRLRSVYTNTVPVDAYRGAGRPEASYLIERAVDHAAREIGMAPDAIRRKNLIKPKALPYTTPTGKVYDSGDFAGTLARAQALADWDGFSRRLRESKRTGKLRGIGIATYVEACGNNGPETARVTLDRDGGITVLIGSQSTGQGHATSYAQLVAERLDIPPERVRVIQGDTDRIPTGAGTGGSSSIPVGGVSVDRASKTLADQMKEIAADALEASAVDMEVVDATVRVAGTDRAITFADLAAHPSATPEKLTAANEFGVDAPTFPNGTHIAEVEIDPDTGATRIIAYVIVDDFGATLNPLMLEGQVHGGTVQGIGQALLEDTVYDAASGQLVSASFMDYAMPRAADAPDFVFETRNVPCKTNPLGVKGAGEAGAIGSCPAVINAVIDALDRAYGIRAIDMPATPQKIWAAIQAATRAAAE
ncbi:MAG TPA: xanthine dehydrogenase family protein molybdopterin-binding subunit [Pseudolabrys sp.]|uniref:xanthine dehydrogenase family protein molybdopterin-binding subunit n=1 Tax=Pseudolabrys sp. TaxID=1960880 RepID=UPI002DDD8C0D|nr:xanthine dehydrogenase family protein molybdopterin-binding subunit [Pseudolabrys sp.]HEV2629185.1 xanthine dehydrogenase family protein molybdopterin-binding subunit [Pseudolabrys sp.]